MLHKFNHGGFVMYKLIVALSIAFLAGCAGSVLKPETPASSVPSKERCVKPSYWTVEDGDWVCKQPRVIRVDPGYGVGYSSFYFRSGPGFGFCRGYYVGAWGPYC